MEQGPFKLGARHARQEILRKRPTLKCCDNGCKLDYGRFLVDIPDAQ